MKEKLKIGHPGGMDCVFHRAGRLTPVPSPGATGQAGQASPDKRCHRFAKKRQIIENGKPDSAIPPKWDGKAAERIVDILIRV